MSATFQQGTVGSQPAASTNGTSGKRKREAPLKFYAVRQGHHPGVYTTYADCLDQVKGFPNAQFKSFITLFEAERFVRDGPEAAARFTTKPQKFYGVRRGWNPGVYTDWPTTQKQVNGFAKPKHKSFLTHAEALAFVNADDETDGDAEASKTKRAKKVPPNEIDESVEPGSGPMPPISQDGFDSRILMNPLTGQVQYKNELQRGATKMQPVGPTPDSVLKIYTDGSALGNGQAGSIAGVGVYFGPRDRRNVSEALRGGRQTNQRAELTAVLRAVEVAPRDRDILIYSDSNYAIKCVTEWFQSWRANGWKTAQKKSVENRDLVEQILQKIEERESIGATTRFQWVKGHASDPGNEAADLLAVEAATRARDKGDGGTNIMNTISR